MHACECLSKIFRTKSICTGTYIDALPFRAIEGEGNCNCQGEGKINELKILLKRDLSNQNISFCRKVRALVLFQLLWKLYLTIRTTGYR